MPRLSEPGPLGMRAEPHLWYDFGLPGRKLSDSANPCSCNKTTQRFQKIATTLADLNAEGLNVQTVNDLLTMYVGAASQHVLRMSFVPEQEAQNFDRQVLAYLVSSHAP